MVETKNGNIMDINGGIICHQVNCKGVMGAGLAKSIADTYPNVLKSYKDFCGKFNYSEDLLGKTLFETVSYDINYKPILIIANIFGQFDYGIYKQQTDYEALKYGLQQVQHVSETFNLDVYIPFKIGCGLGGGDWNIVKNIIKEIFSETNQKCYLIKLEE